jgi:maltose alpha-D-glucosyltransferase/alpha-amylase
VYPEAYYDKNGDGVGDFRGLTEKLDYIKDLGVTAIWLFPFYPSSLWQYADEFGIADYSSIHPIYGTLRDFRQFLKEAHSRDLRVIIELVINHTSDEHAWFQRARQEPPGSRWRNFYVWSDTSDKYRGARITSQSVESSTNWTWDLVAGAYYWHRFGYHQPDLNFDSPQVQRAVIRILDFWMKMGVDGVQLGAIPYLYEREGTSCENLPETHTFLKQLRKHVDQHYADRVLLAEVYQWAGDAVAYFGNGDECHMAFHFLVIPRLFMAMQMEDRYPIIDIMQQTPPIPDICQWAMFLRNYDELTLEMVTDEEWDYIYQVYARDWQGRISLDIRRRLAPLVENDRRKIEVAQRPVFFPARHSCSILW